MNWRLDKACSFTVSPGGNGVESGVRLCLVAPLLDRFWIGLCLLKEELIDSLDLDNAVDKRQTFRLQRAERVTSIGLRNGKVALALNKTELEYWRCFTPVSYTHLDVYKRQIVGCADLSRVVRDDDAARNQQVA